MILGVLIELTVGTVCVVLGALLWAKRKLSILHDYHYRHVKEADIPAYARQMGLGLILIGVGICVTGAFNLFASPYWWIPLPAGFVSGLAVIVHAQKKYNGSVMR